MGIPPTLAEIARISRVSTFTVSLALRHSRRVAEATRAHVWQVARELGYRPNPLVNALMSRVRNRRTRSTGDVVGFVISREKAVHRGQLDYQTRLMQGATARARELGYRIEPIRLTSVNGDGKRLQRVLDTRGIHGVIIGPVSESGAALHLAWDRLACVTVGYSFSEVPVHRVTHNHFRSMRTVLDVCRARGWKRPGLMVSQRVLAAVDHGFLAGYLTGTYRIAHKIPIPPLLYDDAAFARPAFLDWIRKYRIDAVLSLRHDTYDWLAGAGYRVGQDIGLVMLDCNDSADEMSGIDQRQFEVGAAAAEVLAQLMQNGEFGVPSLPRTVGFDGRWREGNTLPVRNRSGGPLPQG